MLPLGECRELRGCGRQAWLAPHRAHIQCLLPCLPLSLAGSRDMVLPSVLGADESLGEGPQEPRSETALQASRPECSGECPRAPRVAEKPSRTLRVLQSSKVTGTIHTRLLGPVPGPQLRGTCWASAVSAWPFSVLPLYGLRKGVSYRDSPIRALPPWGAPSAP